MLWLVPAFAAVPILSDDFNHTLVPMSGNDGWEAGWKDGWAEALGYASSTTSEGDTSSGSGSSGFGEGTAADNWIVNSGATARDFVLDAHLLNLESGAIGLVFRWTAADSYYLMVFTGGKLGPSRKGEDEEYSGGRLYRIDPGERTATQIAETDVAPAIGSTTAVRIKSVDDKITVSVDANGNGTFSSSEKVIEVADTSPLGAGNVGLYAYHNSQARFDDIVLSIEDKDADGIEDTRDVCPEVADPDQTDTNGDGVGDACNDVDHDGFAVDEGDCDDNDAGSHPGAAEVWYDGTDQDCAGGDDFDQDGDGSPIPDDCDDLRKAIHPEANEVPYDGVDQDCADGDLVDVDGDGFPGGTAGTDCDDADADVHPGAGCDPLADDADQDGFPASTDCDDDDATVNPGATDAPNDAIDQNCSGGDAIDRLAGSGLGCSSVNAPIGGLIALLLSALLLRRRR